MPVEPCERHRYLSRQSPRVRLNSRSGSGSREVIIDNDQFHNGRRTKRDSTLAWSKTAESSEKSMRLAGDIELYELLKAQEFSGKDYDDFELEIMSYGFATVRKWIRNDELIAHCKRAGFRGVPTQEEVSLQQLSIDEIRIMAIDIVTDAVLAFREEALIGGQWKPEKNASLRTYFVGRCKKTSVDFLRKLARQRRIEKLTISIEDEGIMQTPARAMDAEQLLEHDEELRRVANILSEEEQYALSLQDQGLSVREIARELGRTTTAVYKLISKARTRARYEFTRKGFA